MQRLCNRNHHRKRGLRPAGLNATNRTRGAVTTLCQVSLRDFLQLPVVLDVEPDFVEVGVHALSIAEFKVI